NSASFSPLEQDIRRLPAHLGEALAQASRAKHLLERLKAQLREVERASQWEPDDGEDEEGDGAAAIERAKLALDEAEARAELHFRMETLRVTQSHVRAAVTIDPEVMRLRRDLLEAKHARR